MVERFVNGSLDVANIDAATITNLFLYGTLDTPENLFDRLKTRDWFESLATVTDENIKAIITNIDAADYFNSVGAGRFARVAELDAVQDLRGQRQAARVTNRLYYGDNLGILREHIADESVDQSTLDL